MRKEGYRLQIFFSDGSIEQSDKWFNTKEEAYNEYLKLPTPKSVMNLENSIM